MDDHIICQSMLFAILVSFDSSWWTGLIKLLIRLIFSIFCLKSRSLNVSCCHWISIFEVYTASMVARLLVIAIRWRGKFGIFHVFHPRRTRNLLLKPLVHFYKRLKPRMQLWLLEPLLMGKVEVIIFERCFYICYLLNFCILFFWWWESSKILLSTGTGFCINLHLAHQKS